MEAFYDRDIDRGAIEDKTIAIIGYGSQGRAHALNLRDSGCKVIVGLRAGSGSRDAALRDGVEVAEVAAAVKRADVTMMLIPDEEQPATYMRDVRDNLKPGSALTFAHGFGIHFGTIVPPANVDVWMCAPKGPGRLVRSEYEMGRGVPCLIAIHQDFTGHARATAAAYASSIGGGRAGILETNFREETETDLFGEQAVLCGGASALVAAGFETLVEAGYAPEMAYFECMHELKLIVDLMYERGIEGMRNSISNTAKYGDYTRGPRIVDDHTKATMKEILSEIQSGAFAQQWVAEHAAGKPSFTKYREAAAKHPIEKVGAKLRTLMPWFQTEKSSGRVMIPAVAPRPRTGGDAVLEALEREGVDVIFGYPGGTIMPFYDALYGHPMRHILVRHEQAAVFAAGGYARTSGRVGVCCATSGPGATNLVTGLVDAMMDSIPLVAITGQVRTALMGTDGFQEADVCAITQCTTKASWLVTDPAQIVTKVREAFALARSGRPGPVLVDIPTDVLKAPYVDHQAPPRAMRDVRAPIASRESVAAAVDAIRTAHRPVAIAGGGARDPKAVAAFRRLTSLLGMPHTTTICGLGASDPKDVHGLGMLGMHGTKAANLTVHTADVVLAFGMRFDDRVTGRPDRFAKDATVVHNDIDHTEFHKIIPAEVVLHGDAAETIDAIYDELQRGHVPRFDDWAIQAKALGGPLAHDVAKPGHLSATDFLDAFFDVMPADAIVCTDVGQHQMWAAQRIRPSTPRDFCTSAGLGSMGFGFPSAVGACFANPGRNVFAICGDGGFQMTMPELATVKRYQVPVKIVLIDNRNLGMVRQWQELFYDERYSATNLSDNPDFCTIASAYDIASFRINGPADVATTLDAFLAFAGPALLHVSCYPDELVWPMIPSGGAVEDLMESKA